MDEIVFIVEKTSDGFSAYAEDAAKIPAFTGGDTMAEVRSNILDAYNSVAELKGWPEVAIDQITLKYDLEQLFDHFGINPDIFAQSIGLDQSQMTRYLSKMETPSEIDLQKIIRRLQHLGQELSSIEV